MALCLLSFFVPVGTVIPQRKKPSPEKTPETTVSRGTTLVAGKCLPTTLARNAGAAIPHTLLSEGHLPDAFPRKPCRRTRTLLRLADGPCRVFLPFPDFMDVLYHGKITLSKVFSLSSHILEACPRKRARLPAKICKSDKASRESVGQKAEARGPNREMIGAEVMIPALIPSFRIVRRGRFASGLTGSTASRCCPGRYRPAAAAGRWGRWCSPPFAGPR